MPGTRQPGGHREVIAVTANTTLTDNDVGKIITNRGAAGAVTITLPTPNVTNKGGTITVLAQADQNLTVTCATLDTLVILNDLAADSVALTTVAQKIGGGMDFLSDGTGWQVLPRVHSGQTISTAT